MEYQQVPRLGIVLPTRGILLRDEAKVDPSSVLILAQEEDSLFSSVDDSYPNYVRHIHVVEPRRLIRDLGSLFELNKEDVTSDHRKRYD